MIKIGDKEYRNLQEQVEKNMKDIKQLMTGIVVLDEFGIKVVGNVESIIDLPSVSEYKEAHEDWAYGDAFAIGTEAPYELYILTRADDQEHPNDYWFYIGEFPMPGPQGEQGIQGETGATGAQGEQGIQGIQGIQGNPGLGIYKITSDLPTTPGEYGNYTIANINTQGRTLQVGDFIIGNNQMMGIVTSIATSTCVVQALYAIKGVKGDTGATGATGETGAKGDPGYSTFFINYYLGGNIGTTDTIGATTDMRVGDGVISVSGKMAQITSIYTSAQDQLVADVEIVADLTGPRGASGTNGQDGQDGVSPSVVVTSITGGHQVAITDATQTQTFDVMDGTDGTDGTDGITPSISADATVNNNVGTPSVTVVKSGTDAQPVFTFNFSNLKGETGTSLINVEVVQTLPASGNAGTLYFVPKQNGSGTDLYDEYIYNNNAWELIGTASVDLTNYIQKSQTSGLVKNDGTIDTNTYALASALADYVTLNTNQTISGAKEFSNIITVKTNSANDVSLQPAIIAHRNNTGTEIQAKVLTIQDISQGSTPESVLTLGDEYSHIVLKGQDVPIIEINGVDKTIATTDQLPDTSNFVTLNGIETISNKTFNTNFKLKNGNRQLSFQLDLYSVPGGPYLARNIMLSLLYEHDNVLDINGLNLSNIKLYNGGLSYGLLLPDTTSFTADKTLATTDQIITSYNDLTDKPTIPTVDYPVTDVQVDGVSVVSNKVANITTPTSVPEVQYLTTAPSAANTSGNLKIVVLNSEPATYYNGYIYYITEA